jgi:hypothetical protein
LYTSDTNQNEATQKSSPSAASGQCCARAGNGPQVNSMPSSQPRLPSTRVYQPKLSENVLQHLHVHLLLRGIAQPGEHICDEGAGEEAEDGTGCADTGNRRRRHVREREAEPDERQSRRGLSPGSRRPPRRAGRELTVRYHAHHKRELAGEGALVDAPAGPARARGVALCERRAEPLDALVLRLAGGWGGQEWLQGLTVRTVKAVRTVANDGQHVPGHTVAPGLAPAAAGPGAHAPGGVGRAGAGARRPPGMWGLRLQ